MMEISKEVVKPQIFKKTKSQKNPLKTSVIFIDKEEHFSILHLIIQSIAQKFNELDNFLNSYKNKYNFICLNEHWSLQNNLTNVI